MAMPKSKRNRVKKPFTEAQREFSQANASRKKEAVKITAGTMMVFKKQTITFTIQNFFSLNYSDSELLNRTGDLATRKIIQCDTLIKFSWEDQRKNEDNPPIQTPISFGNTGTMGKKFTDALYNKTDELLDDRDMDDGDHPRSRNLSVNVNVGMLIFTVNKIYRKKATTTPNEKKWDEYQSIHDYRMDRKDIYLLLCLKDEPYFVLLPAALLKAYRPQINGVV